MEVDFQNPGGRESLLDGRTKKLRGWIFNLKERISKSNENFKSRIISQNKKQIAVGTVVIKPTHHSSWSLGGQRPGPRGLG